MRLLDGYAYFMLAAAPFAVQLAASSRWWPLLLVIFGLPALSLCISVATLSKRTPVRTFASLSPAAAGIGWALTFHIAEQLLAELLRAAQNLIYIIVSLRINLDWALDCAHSYNSRLCMPLFETNVTHGPYHHYPDNFWPAQEFNRYAIRQNPLDNNNLSKVWQANEWYYGRSYEKFYLSLPSMPLALAHCAIWGSIFVLLFKLPQYVDAVLIRGCIILPAVLYLLVFGDMLATHITFGNIEEAVPGDQIEKVPQDFWTDIKGLYRSSILVVDYSTAFTGIALFATSRLKLGTAPLKAWILIPLLMIIPSFLSFIISGCEGHIAKIQPAYRTYFSSDETFTYDILPTCFASTSFGTYAAVLFYIAHFLYTSLGPLILYSLFLHATFSDEFSTSFVETRSFYVGLVGLVTAAATIFYMPFGTKIVDFLRYATQSSTVHLIFYVVVFFVYGWQTLETDISMAIGAGQGSGSLWEYFVGPTSPINTALQFTVVPMLLCTKGVAVYDLLVRGNDVLEHIDAGTQFITAPLFFRRLFGYSVMLMPLCIVLGYAVHAVLSARVRGLSAIQTLQPSAEWLTHQVMQHRPKPFSLVYTLVSRIHHSRFRVFFLTVIILELFFFAILVFQLVLILAKQWGIAVINYRVIVILLFLPWHALALLDMRQALVSWNDPNKLSLYLSVATLETAFLNGYMFLFAFNHDFTLSAAQLSQPLALIIANTFVRGLNICVAIIARADIRETQRPSQTRDVTEMYGDGGPEVEMDIEDDAPIIFDISRA